MYPWAPPFSDFYIHHCCPTFSGLWGVPICGARFSGGSRISQGVDHGKQVGCKPIGYNGDLGMDPLAGSRGHSPWWGSGDEPPLKPKAFCPFSHKRRAKN